MSSFFARGLSDLTAGDGSADTPCNRIYQLEKTVVNNHASTSADPEAAPLLNGEPSTDTEEIFRRHLDADLEKVLSFYQVKELEIYGEVSEMLKEAEDHDPEAEGQVDGPRDVRQNDRPQSSSTLQSRLQGPKPRRPSTLSQSMSLVEDSDEEDAEDETAALNKPRRNAKKRGKSTPAEDMLASAELSMTTKSHRRNSQSYEDYSRHAPYSSAITLKKRAVGLYVQLCELKSFIQLNKTGFAKVLKKFDKICNKNLKTKYIEGTVNPAYPFRQETMAHLDENISKVEKAYASVVTNGDVATAKKELRLHLREHVVWERNTVWREMIGIERKAQAANMGLRRTLLGQDNDPSKARLQGDDDLNVIKEVDTPVGTIRCPSWLLSSSLYTLILIIALFFVLIYVPIMAQPEQQNCLAILVFVSLLWATEVGFLEHHPPNFTNMNIGNSSVRNISVDTIPGCGSPSCQIRRQALSSSRIQASHLLYLCSHVDSSHYAPARWLYHRCGAFKIRHCKAHCNVCSQQSWN